MLVPFTGTRASTEHRSRRTPSSASGRVAEETRTQLATIDVGNSTRSQSTPGAFVFVASSLNPQKTHRIQNEPEGPGNATGYKTNPDRGRAPGRAPTHLQRAHGWYKNSTVHKLTPNLSQQPNHARASAPHGSS